MYVLYVSREQQPIGAKAVTLRKDADGAGWKCYSIKPKPTKAEPHAFTFTTARNAKPLDKGYP